MPNTLPESVYASAVEETLKVGLEGGEFWVEFSVDPDYAKNLHDWENDFTEDNPMIRIPFEALAPMIRVLTEKLERITYAVKTCPVPRK